jgi:hypothetical protein
VVTGTEPGGSPTRSTATTLTDLDIRKFFDSVPWELVVTAVEANTDLLWAVMYVKW